MATIEDLDADISDLNERIALAKAHRSNLASILLSQPHLQARLQAPSTNKSEITPHEAIERQSRRNLENVYRACAGVTAYKVQDPDPNAANNGNIMGVSIDVAIGGRFIDTYHVLLTWRRSEDGRLLKIHKHTIPPCMPLQPLANKWLPQHARDADADPEQDLIKFGRLLRKELVSWHMRVQAIEDLRKEAGLPSAKVQDGQDTSLATTGRILNAFVSDDEASSDIEEEEPRQGPARISDIGADAAVRQVTVTWSDQRTLVAYVTKDGRVEKAVCRTKGGARDKTLDRQAIGPLTALSRRLKA